MPDYQFTALDPYGQETTGQFSADDSEAAAERVKAMGLFATEISELTGESRIGEPIGLLAGLNDAFMWMLCGVVIPCMCIWMARQPPEELEGKQWFVIPIMMWISYTISGIGLRKASGLRARAEAAEAADKPTSHSGNPALSPPS